MNPTKRRLSRTPVVIFFALAFFFARGAAVFASLNFPVPPQQYAPWKAPATRLSAELVGAARDLFVLGLPDPRGCEYREITITVGDVWGHVRDVKTRGWVLPSNSAAGGTQKQFGIAWNGLIYPLQSSGARFNVRDDLTNLPPFEIREALPETASVNCPPQSLLGVCLLLRLGESASAETLWRAARRSPLSRTDIKRGAPFEELSSQWAWTIWNRALCAHLRGADELSLQDARLIHHLQGQIENRAQAARRKSKNKARFQISFLAPLRLLLSDQERRAKNETFKSSTEIAALMRDLENVSARQWGQPGGVDLTTSPVVQEIIAHGNEAVPALLDTMAQDYRLTRAVSFHREYFTDRHLISVAETAYVALQKITGQSFGPVEDVSGSYQKRVSLVQRARLKLQKLVATIAVKPTGATLPQTAKTSAARPIENSIRAVEFQKAVSDLAAKNLLIADFQIFEPLWRFPQDAALYKVADGLFNGKKSRWNPLIDPRRPISSKESEQWSSAVCGPLITVPAYRAQAARQLRNWATCGTVEILAGRKMRLRLPAATLVETVYSNSARPPVGTKEEFRVCDFYAWQLANIQGAPRCELFWPFEKRDLATANVAEWLQIYGAMLKPALATSATTPAQLVFPILKNTATPFDVQNHRAIFSLQGLGKTRVANLKLPALARWKNQNVTIWQAEEVQVGTAWRRHYGIVAPHEIRRVAASEIELLKAK